MYIYETNNNVSHPCGIDLSLAEVEMNTKHHFMITASDMPSELIVHKGSLLFSVRHSSSRTCLPVAQFIGIPPPHSCQKQ
jgi:hypothetical protein